MAYSVIILCSSLLVVLAVLFMKQAESSHSELVDTSGCPANASEGCPTWFVPENGCTCGNSLNGIVHCEDHCHVSLLTCYCMNYDEDTGETVVGTCLYNCFNESYCDDPIEYVYRPLPQNVSDLNSAVCGSYHRDGQLCGKCEQGYIKPLYAYTLKCVSCDHSAYEWLKLIFFSLVPVTVFYFIIICCRISVATGPLNAFVHIVQSISAPVSARTLIGSMEIRKPHSLSLIAVRTLTALYGVWNLDFFRTFIPPICIPMTTLQILAFEYVTAFYPFLLILATYVLIELHAHNFRPVVCMWKPFHKCFARFRIHWNIQTSLVGALATFLLLSYTRLLNVSFDLLLPTELYDVNGTRKNTMYLYYDGTVEYFGKEHFPYATVALAVFLIFSVLPLIFLLLYPLKCCSQFLQKCSPRQFHAIRSFAEAFQGCYKDGTCGTYDCRYFAVVYFLARIVAFAVYAWTRNSIFFPLAALMLLGVVASLIIFQPYKVTFYNSSDAILILALAMYFVSVAAALLAEAKAPQFLEPAYIMAFLFALIPSLYATGVIFYWLLVHKKLVQKFKTWITARKQRRRNTVMHCSMDDSFPDRLVSPGNYTIMESL